MSTKAVILVGGDTRGTRFRPISLSVPKVLFPAGTKSLLAHAVEACIAAKVSEILLVGYYENSVFDQFIAEVNRDYPDVPIRYLREYKAMGTAGGLYHFRDQILRGSPERFFLIHADVCCAYPLAELLKLQRSKNAEAVILGTRVPKQMSVNFGSIITAEASTGTADNDPERVVHFVEKPDEPLSTLVNGGVYLLSVKVFDLIAKAKLEHESKESFIEDFDDDLLPIERDVIPQLADEGKLYVYTTNTFWRQVKEASSALVANRLELEQADIDTPELLAKGDNIVGPVFVDPSAVIDKTAKIGPNVTIGAGVRIGEGARVKDSVILSRVQIKPDAVVLNSILCPGSRVGKWARVEGSVTALNEYESFVVKDGVKIPRVSILAENVSVSDEIHVQNSVVLPHKDIKADIKNEIVM
ncbi:hypothetical protein DASB73_042450 [Starmerella bacillaris]|uniref:mannose-1-phosphate guanylyltransferase n=1 Tax=Starmerella bacillaris TaxID=1247836 RepID=A0AAV5RPV8_STABA|nr:hypothetical protein DASB73_042450 [Starmerella bacillaris]